ncbi:MAG: sugar kinase [Treponema sp.]|nr:sugar kinase [Treponema sp.]
MSKTVKKTKIITFGELMLRLMPFGYERFIQTETYNAQFGGAEANVAVSLANFGMESVYVTKLPENPIGQAALNSLRRYGVNTDYIARGGERMGIYFLEKGASQRGSLCIYDRKNSSLSQSSADDYDWKEIFKDASWFHVTGITPALSAGCADIVLTAVKEAKKLGLTVSCDLNYRSKLWTTTKAKKVMTEIAVYTDVCIANEEDAQKVFGIKTSKTNVDAGIIDKDAYSKTAKDLAVTFGFKKVAITLRQSINASRNNWSALLYDGKEAVYSKQYSIDIIERVGSGDAFAAALIYALIQKDQENELFRSNRDCIEFASAAACLKHTVEGDYNMFSADEVLALSLSNGTGRVVR